MLVCGLALAKITAAVAIQMGLRMHIDLPGGEICVVTAFHLQIVRWPRSVSKWLNQYYSRPFLQRLSMSGTSQVLSILNFHRARKRAYLRNMKIHYCMQVPLVRCHLAKLQM
jgi:hypothetical protein